MPPFRKKCVLLLTGYCHGCNIFGNSETQYISIMGKRGLTVYFIASTSVLCLCVRVFLLTAGFWQRLSGLWLMKTEVMKDIFNKL